MTASPRRRQLVALVPRLPALVRWPPVAVASAGAALLLAWQWSAVVASPLRALVVARLALLVVVSGSLALFDDAARRGTEAVPLPLRWRVVLRGGVAVVVVGGWVAVVAPLLLGRAGLAAASGGLVLEAATVLAVGLAVLLLMQRRLGFEEPSQYAGVVLLLAPLALLALDGLTGGRWSLLAPPGGQWDDAHRRWFALLVMGVACCLWLTRDPAGRSWRALGVSGEGTRGVLGGHSAHWAGGGTGAGSGAGGA